MPLPPYIKRPDGRRSRGSARLPDDVRAPAPARSRRRPPACTSRPELLAALAGRGIAPRLRDPARRRRHLPAGQGRGHRASTACTPSAASSAPQTVAAIERARAAGGRIVAVGTTVLRHAGDRRRRAGGLAPVARRDAALHHPGLPLPGGRRAAHQLPPAALDAVHAGRGLRRARAHAGRLRPRDRGAATASTPTATPACWRGPGRHDRGFASSFWRDATARRGAAGCTRRTATVETPAFMPVGTAATVKAMTPDDAARDRRARSSSPTPTT